ncbi:MAG: FHA domain-containing protein [Ilumatobacter sp.]|jgi:hypothetical protein|nr:MAG: FHA domain-containing protein [Ilumatobacter sp.]
MTDPVLDILKLVLLALLYVFFARVLWAVWSEVRQPTRRQQVPVHAGSRMAPDDPTAVAERPGRREKVQRKPQKGRGGRVARLVVLEPKALRGTAYALTGEITIGRDAGCTISMPDDTFVSTIHARVFDHEGQPMIEDLGSTNGSFHNGSRLLGSRLLHPGDRVQVGYTVLEAQ